MSGAIFHTAHAFLHCNTHAISISSKTLYGAPHPTPPTLGPHRSSSEYKQHLNSRYGTDPTGCLGSYVKFTEMNVLTVTQPQEERSFILL